MKWIGYLLFAVGSTALIALVAYYGYADIAAALAAAAWGVVLVTAFHVVPLAADTVAWRWLLPPDHRGPLRDLVWMRWVSESVNNLLPAAQVGGDLIRGRLAAQRGVPAADAAASIVADITTSVLTLIAFGALGALLLFPQHARQSAALLLGLALSALLVGVFWYLQRAGLFAPLARRLAGAIGGSSWEALVGGAAALDAAIAKVYTRRVDVLKSCAWALTAWLLGAGEVWIALYFLGSPVGLAEAIAIESLIQALRSAAFPVPGALGVQEGGFILLGHALGLTPETSLALSLVKRVREVVLGIPGVIVWQLAEARHVARARGASPSAGTSSTERLRT
jgi:putative membrane protein